MSTPSLQLREVSTVADLEEVSLLLTAVWNSAPGTRQISTAMLRALSVTGNYIAAAYVDGRLVGASVAFFAPATGALHSHITGVDPSAQARSVGHLLKLHQRDWAAERGIATLTWTFDPLIRRNAYFNLAKLGATATAYLPDLYGPMDDALNRGEPTDRLMVTWPVHPDVAGEPVRTPHGLPVLVRTGHAHLIGAPWTGGRALLPVPADVEQLRVDSPELARAWRRTVAEVLGGALSAGAVVVGFARDHGYLLDDAPVVREDKDRVPRLDRAATTPVGAAF